jgi:chemotaxis signal transduction protein
MHKFVIIRVDQQLFAIELPHIRQITSVDKIAPAAASATGQKNQAPVVDLNRFFDKQRVQTQLKADRKALVLNTHNRLMTVIADRVDTVLSIHSDQLSALPEQYPHPVRRLLPRVLRHQGQLILLIDPWALGDWLYDAPVFGKDATLKSRYADHAHAAGCEDVCTAETESRMKAQLGHALIQAAT